MEPGQIVASVVGGIAAAIGFFLLFRDTGSGSNSEAKSPLVSFSGPPGLVLAVAGLGLIAFSFSPWWPSDSDSPVADADPGDTTAPSSSAGDIGTVVIAMEAEQGELVGPLVDVPDATASGGAFVHSPERESGTVTLEFDAPVQGKYFFWGRVSQPESEVEDRVDLNDTFFVQLDGSDLDIWDFVENKTFVLGDWTWDQISLRCGGTFNTHLCDPFAPTLDAGPHTLVLGARDPFARLDAIEVTNDPFYSPHQS
jgi:hypothetical protein